MQYKSKLFTVILIIITLLSLTVLSAIDSHDDIVGDGVGLQEDNVISIHEQISTDDVNDEVKTISKTARNNKKSVKTTDVKNYNALIQVLNEAVNDTDNDEYIINLKKGTYTSTTSSYDYWPNATNKLNIIINGNNQTIETQSQNRMGIYVNENYNLTFNDLNIKAKLRLYGNTTIKNSVIDELINNYGILDIDDNTILESSAKIEGNGTININDINRIVEKMGFFNGTYTIVNKTMGSFSNYGNITFINCTSQTEPNPIINVWNYNDSCINLINCTMCVSMRNYGVLVLSDDSVILNGSTFYTNDDGIIINDTNRIVRFFKEINGNYTFNDEIFTGHRVFNGSIICNNCNLSSTTNGGSLTLNNSTSSNRISTYPNSNLTIYNSTLHEVSVYTNSTCTIYDSNLGIISIYGNLTLNNIKINNNIFNLGVIEILGDVEFGDNCELIDQGQIIIEDASKLFNIMGNLLNANYTVKNINITSSKVNYGNLTIINSTILSQQTNHANLTLSNTTINALIDNDGVIVIGDDCVFGNQFRITGDGSIVINDTDKIKAYLSTYNGNYILNNSTISTSKTNMGNLTIIDSTINAIITNGGNLTVRNSTLNNKIVNRGKLEIEDLNIDNTIENYGLVIICDNVTFTDSFSITGSGDVICNNTEAITPHLSTYNGNYIIHDTNITTDKVNNANLTIINTSTYSNIKNQGNLTINDSLIYDVLVNTGYTVITNSTLKSTIENTGTLVIDDDVTFDESFILSGDGEVIINNTDKIKSYLTNYHGNITLENMNIMNPKNNYGNLTIINCTISALITNNPNSQLTIINSTATNNTRKASVNINDGGSIILNLANVTIVNSVFKSNKLTPKGNSQTYVTGGVIFSSGNMTITNSVFEYNEAYSGGCIATRNSSKLLIENTTFTQNIARDMNSRDTAIVHGGVIYSQETDNIIINNCTFQDNLVRYSIANRGGGYGGAIYATQSNLKIANTTFESNNAVVDNGYTSIGARGGAIYHAASQYLNITDSTFTDNKADSTSTWSSESGSGGAIYTNNVQDINIQNSQFNNNKALSPLGIEIPEYNIYSSLNGYGGSLIILNAINTDITENVFINSTSENDAGALYITSQNVNLTSNNFTNITTQNESNIVISENKNIEDNSYTNCTMQFANLTLAQPEDVQIGKNVTLELAVELENPEGYDNDILDKASYTWTVNNNKYPDQSSIFSIRLTSEDLTAYATPSFANARSNIITTKSTTEGNVTITPENIGDYLIEEELTGIGENTKVIFEGNFNDLGDVKVMTDNLLLDGTSATFTNTTFIIITDYVTVQNMNIDNRDSSPCNILNVGNYNIIQNNTLTTYNNAGQTSAIENDRGENVIIQNNIVNVTGPALSIGYDDGVSIANTQGILSIGGQNNLIAENNITVSNSTDPEKDEFCTIEAITAPMGTNNTITLNTIHVTGARFNYGINTLNTVTEYKITENNITVTGYRYTDGIQVGNNANNNLIANNNINLTCLNTSWVDEAAISYGIIITRQDGQTSNNNTITQNNITINGIVNYGIEVYTATNTLITENNITLHGAKSTGIGFAHSPNATVIANNITTDDDSTININSITEEIQPFNTGIRIQQESTNILIEDNIIITYDKNKNDTTINAEDENITIRNNQLKSSTKVAEKSITTTKTIIIQNNTAVADITEDELEDLTYTTITITPETLTDYITGENTITDIAEYTKIIFEGEFDDLNIQPNNNNIIIDGRSATFTNTHINTETDNITIRNINIENTDNTETIINVTGNNIKIYNNTLTQENNNTKTRTIKITTTTNTLIENNTITTKTTLMEDINEYPEITTEPTSTTQSILIINSQNTTIHRNTITTINTTEIQYTSTLNTITLINTTNTDIQQNTIKVTWTDNTTIITTYNTTKDTITNNNIITEQIKQYSTIIVTSININNYKNNWGIVVFPEYSIIKLQGTFKGLYMGCIGNTILDGTDAILNNTIITINGGNNTIQNMKITNYNYATSIIEINNANNSTIKNNTITQYNTILNEYDGLELTLSNTISSIQSNNINITNNKLVVAGPSLEEKKGYAYITSQLIPQTTAILSLAGENITITQNNITATNYTKPTTNSTINAITLINMTDIQIHDNILNVTGADNTTAINLKDTTNEYITNNKIIKNETITINPITAEINQPITITAVITTNTDTQKGQVYFTINGKILRDSTTGKILYAQINDETATITYTVPKTWTEDTQIQAIYTNKEEQTTTTSPTINPSIKIAQEETTQQELSVTDLTATSGSEVTITVTTKNLDGGKVVLKVNGKTVKSSDGKLYAKTSGETTTFTYTVPKTFKTGDYIIKAVYTSGATKLEADAKLIVE